MRWLAECSAEALGEALRMVAPELSGYPVAVPIPDPAAQADPLWWSSSTVVGERFVVKFAWSRPAALRLARETGIPLADHRTPPEWVDDLAARFSMLGIDPETPPTAPHGRGTAGQRP